LNRALAAQELAQILHGHVSRSSGTVASPQAQPRQVSANTRGSGETRCRPPAPQPHPRPGRRRALDLQLPLRVCR
jgi:hypothetical protein